MPNMCSFRTNSVMAEKDMEFQEFIKIYMRRTESVL